MALAKAILKGESASKDIKTTSIKNFGGDRDWDAFEAHYMGMMESFEEPKTELIETAVQNEKDNLSAHDGHGESFAEALTEAFGIKGNPNFMVCSIPKDEETQKPHFDSLLDYDGEITSTFVYYEGKGKNQKRVEVDAANLADYIPQEKLASGIQLSLF